MEPMRGNRRMPMAVASLIAILAILAIAFAWPW
jgi:hypothetical protein